MSSAPLDSKAMPVPNSFLPAFNRKRRHTFRVDLKVERVVSLPYANGKFFFKIRLLNGGTHLYICQQRFEVNENKVEFNQSDQFTVKMTSRVENFTLDHCFCRISIRKEGRAGRSFEKIGFVDLDLASVAGCGDESKACLLNGYQQTNTNPANAYLEIRMKLTVMEGDHIFRRPESDHPSIKIERLSPQKSLHSDLITEETNVDVHPSLVNRGHSRQASKSSVCSTASGNSVPTSLPDRLLPSSIVDEDAPPSHHKRRTPFIDQFGDIQRRLQSTRVDVNQIVNEVINNNQQRTANNSNGYLCLMYNDDGTARIRIRMVEVKLCLSHLDGTIEYRRLEIPVLTPSTDVLSILRAKLLQFTPRDEHVDLQIQYEDPCRGLVLVTDGEGINNCARGQASRQEVLRLFVQFHVEKRGGGWNSLSSSSSKHIGVICDGCQRTPIVGIRYKCLQCSNYDLCEECADQRLIHSEHVLAKIRSPHQIDVVRELCSIVPQLMVNQPEEKNDDDLEVISVDCFLPEEFVQVESSSSFPQ